MKTTDMQTGLKFIGSRVVSFAMTNDFVSLNLQPYQVVADVDCEIIDISHEKDFVSGIIQLTVSAVTGKNEDEEDSGALTFKLELEGCFAAPEKTEDEQMEKLLLINGSAMLYSAARAYIASVTALSLQGGKIALPTVNTFCLYDDYKEKKTKEQ